MANSTKRLITLMSAIFVLTLISTSRSQLGDLFSDSPPQLEATEPVARPQNAGADEGLGIDGGHNASRRFAPTRVRQHARVVVEHVHEQIPSAEIARGREIAKLREELRAAKDDATRKKLAAQFRSLIESVFDEDLHQREQELEKVEARIKKLRDAVERRKAARERIIDLQVNTVMLEAEGLTFPAIFPKGPTSFSSSSDPTRNSGNWIVVPQTDSVPSRAAETPDAAPAGLEDMDDLLN